MSDIARDLKVCPSTISRELIFEIRSILENKGFRVSKIWRFISKPAYTKTYRFGIKKILSGIITIVW